MIYNTLRRKNIENNIVTFIEVLLNIKKVKYNKVFKL